MRYDIIRFKFKEENEFIKSVDTLEEAQAHCNQEDTHGDGWFDGYREQNHQHRHGLLESAFKILADERNGR